MSPSPTTPNPIRGQVSKGTPQVLISENQNIDSSVAISPSRKGSGRLASEILNLFSSGAFSFWHWFPSNNVLSTHGDLTADSLEEWMVRVHPRDQEDFSKFIDQDWQTVDLPSFLEYRFTPNRQGDWVRVRHTATYSVSGKQPVLSCLIESFALAQQRETPMEKVAEGFKDGEEELLRFVESAIDLRVQHDPVPRLELLQRSIRADLMVLVHFGSKIVVTHTLPLPRDTASDDDAHLHLHLIEAIASMDPMDQTRPFDLDLAPGSAEITHFIVNPIHWDDGFKGALCAGYARKVDRIGDHHTTTRLSLISAFTDGQLGRRQRIRAREEILGGFRKVQFQPLPSNPGIGSLVKDPNSIGASTPAANPRRISLTEANLKGTTILLVEDETAVRKLVRKLLEMLGCSVIESVSGKDALELWPTISDRVTLIVSDVVMPGGVSGWDLANDLHQRHPDLGILLTSGYDELPEDHGLRDLPQIGFLQKPYEISKLKTTLCRLMASKLDA